MHVNGSVAGTSAYNNLSDARLKTDIKPLTSSLDKLDGLHGITFKWIDPKKMKEDRQQIGFLAQDVEKVFPEAVTHQNDGYLSVAYSMLIPPVLEAVKELHESIKSILNRLNSHDAVIAQQADSLTKQNEMIIKLQVKNKELEERLIRLEKATLSK